MSRRILLVITFAALGCAIFAWVPAAQAGTWIQVSCVNPDGSAAPSEGWSAASTGTPEAGSSGSARCPMYGELSPIGGAAKVGDSEYVQYSPPDGSKLIGGALKCELTRDDLTRILLEGFFPEVTVAFHVRDPERNYHVPLLLSHYGYTTYRGS